MQKLQNVYPIDVFSLSDNGIRKYIDDWNKSKKSIAILGYASVIVEIAKYVSRNKILKNFKIHSIITMSEALEEKSRTFVAEIFDCTVFERYSNVENGIIAQNYNVSSGLLINSASYNIEIFKTDKEQLQEEGKPGRIIITDFYNKGMPMIRYDSGDIGSKRTIVSGNKIIEILEKVEGRKMDCIYDTKGNLLSSFIITNGMWDYPEIIQYQFIQLADLKYKFKINIDQAFKSEEKIISQFKKQLGYDAQIEFEYVNEIPLLSSGKRKKVLNLNN
jgi:phenylacetate-CoA ligase